MFTVLTAYSQPPPAEMKQEVVITPVAHQSQNPTDLQPKHQRQLPPYLEKWKGCLSFE